MTGLLLSLAIAFAVVMFLVVVYTRRMADLLVTDKFRAAESLSNGSFPEKWRRQIQAEITLRSLLSLRTSPEKNPAIRKIDQLYLFFEHSPFFENEEARQLLLARLAETRQRWSTLTLEEILTDG